MGLDVTSRAVSSVGNTRSVNCWYHDKLQPRLRFVGFFYFYEGRNERTDPPPQEAVSRSMPV